jgi:hypothetical protein
MEMIAAAAKISSYLLFGSESCPPLNLWFAIDHDLHFTCHQRRTSSGAAAMPGSAFDPKRCGNS